MATFIGPRAGAGIVPADPGLGAFVEYGIAGYIDITAAPAASDIYQILWVPAGFTVTGGLLIADEIDTHGTETFDADLGWAANGGSLTHDSVDADGLGNFGVWTGDAFATPSISSSTGNVIPLSGILADGIWPAFSKKTMIQLTCVAVSETFPTAPRVSLVVRGFVDPSIVAG